MVLAHASNIRIFGGDGGAHNLVIGVCESGSALNDRGQQTNPLRTCQPAVARSLSLVVAVPRRETSAHRRLAVHKASGLPAGCVGGRLQVASALPWARPQARFGACGLFREAGALLLVATVHRCDILNCYASGLALSLCQFLATLISHDFNTGVCACDVSCW